MAGARQGSFVALLVLASAVCAVQLGAEQSHELGPAEALVSDLGESDMDLAMAANKQGVMTFLGQPEMTLGEIQAIADGSRVLNSHAVRQFRDRFVQLAEKIESNDLKNSALMLAQMSSDDLQKTKKRAGLKLIFTKLADLEEKVKKEGAEDLRNIEAGRLKCQKNLKAANEVITTAGEKKSKNDLQLREDQDLIRRSREERVASRASEGTIQNQFDDMRSQRE